MEADMADKASKEGKEEDLMSKRSSLYEISRKVLLATVGAVVLAQDEAKNFVDNLVERGELAEKDAQDLVQELSEKRIKLAEERERELAKRKGYVTKAEVEQLTKQIAELNKKIEELKKK